MKKCYFNYLAVVMCVFMSCGDAKEEVIPSDITPPVITMLGKNPDTLIVKTAASYADPGATAADDKDGNITSKIVVASNVNVSVPGHYLIYYNVEDNAHNLAPKLTRVVEVVKADATYDASTTCMGSTGNSVTITSYSNNDSIIINDFYAAGTVIKAGLNNYKYKIVPFLINGVITVNGDLTAAGTTLNGNVQLTGGITA
ncbi:MAG TPA: immunoglobulin-like domain-containing protein, partial [Bacteroidia bacterium]|nr:immunoglobulin-like domain-containing protein [Bacteroidia bacterium]